VFQPWLQAGDADLCGATLASGMGMGMGMDELDERRRGCCIMVDMEVLSSWVKGRSEKPKRGTFSDVAQIRLDRRCSLAKIRGGAGRGPPSGPNFIFPSSIHCNPNTNPETRQMHLDVDLHDIAL
jgi:hypothetical protein